MHPASMVQPQPPITTAQWHGPKGENNAVEGEGREGGRGEERRGESNARITRYCRDSPPSQEESRGIRVSRVFRIERGEEREQQEILNARPR